jgi:hypothetical protein
VAQGRWQGWGWHGRGGGRWQVRCEVGFGGGAWRPAFDATRPPQAGRRAPPCVCVAWDALRESRAMPESWRVVLLVICDSAIGYGGW